MRLRRVSFCAGWKKETHDEQLPAAAAGSCLAEAKRLAAANGASLNQFLSSLIAERLGEMKAIAEIEARVARANPEVALEILRRAPDRPPLPGDSRNMG